jgi:hypothetical protein
VARRPRTITTTHDIENVTWPITCAVVPSPMNANEVVNSRNMPTAKTSSGITSGSSISTFTGPDPGPRHFCSPSASAVPSGVAISIVSAASSSDWPSAASSVGSWSTLRLGSPVNQRSEKPCSAVRERPSLKAKRIASSTGSNDQMMYSQVVIARKRGRPHGFANHSRTEIRRRATAGASIAVTSPAGRAAGRAGNRA